jgi:hypothetical protein
MFQVIHHDAFDLYSNLCQEPLISGFLDRLYDHHYDTHCHSLRVGLLTVDLGMENHLSDHHLRLLGTAALLHDVGKLNIPASVLSKPGRLAPHEIALMRAHPWMGVQILGELFPKEVLGVVAAHHDYTRLSYLCPESFQGGDFYPCHSVNSSEHQPAAEGLSLPIPVTGVSAYPTPLEWVQIVAVADMYDAISSRRSYKPSFSNQQTSHALRVQFMGEPRFLHQVLWRNQGSTGGYGAADQSVHDY